MKHVSQETVDGSLLFSYQLAEQDSKYMYGGIYPSTVSDACSSSFSQHGKIAERERESLV